MRKLTVFNSVTLDGYFTGKGGDMQWAHEGQDDPEWQQFVAGNAGGGGALLLGRVTWEMMASWWPTPMAAKAMPQVAQGMNRMTKYTLVVTPLAIGEGRTMFENAGRVSLKPAGARQFRNGTVVLSYTAA